MPELTRALRVLMVHPGASWSTSDVYDGLNHGLRELGVHVIPYRLDNRLPAAYKVVQFFWRRENQVRKAAGEPLLAKPGDAHTIYQAGIGALEVALRHQVDVVLVISATLLHPDVVVLMKRAGLRVTVLFTESPYDVAHETQIAKLVDGCWTIERTSVPAFRAVTRQVGYLRHGWHPVRHAPDAPNGYLAQALAHDVVFVGSGFGERIAFFNACDWTGIDLGLYGSWKEFGLRADLLPCVRAAEIPNAMAAALYRRAKIGLNLYRDRDHDRRPVHGESLSPRAYELAACGVFHLSAYRAEVPEVFGDLVPTFRTPAEAMALIRRWLPDADGRARIASQLPACVAESRWTERAATVLGDLQSLVAPTAARRSA